MPDFNAYYVQAGDGVALAGDCKKAGMDIVNREGNSPQEGAQRSEAATLADAQATAEAVRELASRLKIFTREREELLAAERAARNEAEEAIRQKDEFIATLSHELRTPLANVLNWTHVLQERFDGVDPLLKKGLGIIAENTTAQARLISDLLDVSRIDAGKVALELKPVDFGQFVASAVSTQRPHAEAKGVSMSTEIADDLDRVLIDPVRMQQVLWNLITNAVKFTPSGGRILIAAVRAGNFCEVRVCDSGEGLAPEFLPQLFTRFTQASGPNARRLGLGLGLSLVKQLVELHGGQVDAQSDGPGHGATFVVRLPLRPVETHAPAEVTGSWKIDPEAMSPESLKGLRILAVDDQPAMLEYLARTLKEHGAEVWAVSSGEQALRSLNEDATCRFHVVVSDISMPGMDGYELIRMVREFERRKGVRLTALAVTAFSRDEDRARILEAGFEAHISKPIEVAQLITAVRELVHRRPEG